MGEVSRIALKGAPFVIFAASFWFGASPAAAGSLCPAYVVQNGATERSPSLPAPVSGTVVFPGFSPTPVNGACTNFGQPGVFDPAAFSGAALASQALSELSQSTSPETG